MVLLLTVVAALWPRAKNDTADGVATSPSTLRSRAPVLNAPTTLQLRSLTPASPAQNREIGDLFAHQTVTPPATYAAPEQPTAPPLPFTYGGRYTEGKNVFVFLSEGEKMHTARLGDTIDAKYRIEKIGPAAITLTYLPLGLEQTLQTGSTTPP
jgi:hypothetical protein